MEGDEVESGQAREQGNPGHACGISRATTLEVNLTELQKKIFRKPEIKIVLPEYKNFLMHEQIHSDIFFEITRAVDGKKGFRAGEKVQVISRFENLNTEITVPPPEKEHRSTWSGQLLSESELKFSKPSLYKFLGDYQ